MSRNIFYFHKKIPAHFCTRIFKSFLLETNPLLPLSFASFQVGERVLYHYAIRFIRYVPDLTGIACFHLLYTYTSVFRKLLSRVGRLLPHPTPSARRLLHWPPFRFCNPVFELLFKPYWRTMCLSGHYSNTLTDRRDLLSRGTIRPWYLFYLTSKGYEATSELPRAVSKLDCITLIGEEFRIGKLLPKSYKPYRVSSRPWLSSI
jgi:hypothetical protein